MNPQAATQNPSGKSNRGLVNLCERGTECIASLCKQLYHHAVEKFTTAASVYYTKRKLKNKNEGGLGMRLRSHLCYGETPSSLCRVKINHQGVSCHLKLPNEEFATRTKMQPSDRHSVLKKENGDSKLQNQGYARLPTTLPDEPYN